MKKSVFPREIAGNSKKIKTWARVAAPGYRRAWAVILALQNILMKIETGAGLTAGKAGSWTHIKSYEHLTLNTQERTAEMTLENGENSDGRGLRAVGQAFIRGAGAVQVHAHMSTQRELWGRIPPKMLAQHHAVPCQKASLIMPGLHIVPREVNK